METSTNYDSKTVQGFGDEWTRFDQSSLDSAEHLELWQRYFGIFPWDELPADAQGFDMGCGSGRWAKLVAPRVGGLFCIDASSEALRVARKNLEGLRNCFLTQGSFESIPLEDNSMDFGYSLGVLHHIPHTRAGLQACVAKLKPGAPFLLYIYYAFDNRSAGFRALWRVSDRVRRTVSRMPMGARYAMSQGLAAGVYWPLARAAQKLEKAGKNVESFPLSYYRDSSFYTMRTDALDRFGTRLEKRFTKRQIEAMMKAAGLERIRFSNDVPYWCAVGYKSANGADASGADANGADANGAEAA